MPATALRLSAYSAYVHSALAVRTEPMAEYTVSHLFVAFVTIQFYSLLFVISAHVSYVSVQKVLSY